MAVLEAFVYDPLINWRLLKTNNEPKHDNPGDDSAAAAGPVAVAGKEDGVGGAVGAVGAAGSDGDEASRGHRTDRDRELMQRIGTFGPRGCPLHSTRAYLSCSLSCAIHV
jgi:hypothetical protein